MQNIYDIYKMTISGVCKPAKSDETKLFYSQNGISRGLGGKFYKQNKFSGQIKATYNLNNTLGTL